MKALNDQSHDGQQRPISIGQPEDDHRIWKTLIWNVGKMNNKEHELMNEIKERELDMLCVKLRENVMELNTGSLIL